jgi:hypothetical protein
MTKIVQRSKPVIDKVPVPEKTVFIPLADIAFDFDFNARSRANVLSEPDDGVGGGLAELADSLRTQGQDDPIIVRPNDKNKGVRRKDKSYPPYEAVDGFRRGQAALALNADEKAMEAAKEAGRTIIPNVPDGHILGVVRKLDDLEATLLNGRMSLSRNNLDAPDMMTYLLRLARPPIGMNAAAIAEDQGVGLGTVHRYLSVGQALLPEILVHWRTGGAFDGVASAKRASLEEIESVSKLAPPLQKQAYKAIILGKKADEEKKGWFASAEKAAVRKGAELARLEKAGVIQVLIGEGDWRHYVGALIKVPGTAKDKSRIALGEQLEAGFKAEKKRDETKKESTP